MDQVPFFFFFESAYPSYCTGLCASDIQIHIIQLQLLQTRLDGTWDIRHILHDLGSHEQLFTRHLALLDRHPQFRFGVVDLCAIQVAVAQADGGFDGLNQVTVDRRGVAFLVPGCAGAISQLQFVSSLSQFQ